MKTWWTGISASHPAVVASALLVLIFVILSVTSTAVGFWDSPFELDQEHATALFTTSAQVIAGIYGLTLTGFIFFRNELDREGSEDETLAEAVEALKIRYFRLLLVITAFAFASIFLSNAVISLSTSSSTDVLTVAMNVAQSAFTTTLIAVGFFVFDVISPRRIQAASQALQDKVDPPLEGSVKGDLEVFLKIYNRIEDLLQRYGQDVRIVAEYRPSRRVSNARLAEMLFRSRRITEEMYERIVRIVTVRNSIIHGAEPRVSLDVLNEASSLLKDLEVLLEPEA